MLMLFGLLLASAGSRNRIQSPLGQTNAGTSGMAVGS